MLLARYRIMILSVLISIFIINAAAFCDNPPQYTPSMSLLFKFEKDTVFVSGTAGDTIGYINFLLQDYAQIENVDEIQFQFAVDTSIVHIIEVIPTDNWPENNNVSLIKYNDTTFRVILSTSSSITTPESYVCYAQLKCYLKCTTENTDIPIRFYGLMDNYYEYPIANGTERKYVNSTSHFTHGAIRSADYIATTQIDSVVAIGGVKKQVTVPVYYSANFNTYNMHQFIIFDTALIQFDTGYVADTSLWLMQDVEFSHNKDTIKVNLIGAAPDSPDPLELYYLKFTTKAVTYWNDQGISYTADVAFLDDSCYVHPARDSLCSQLKAPYGLVDGEIKLGVDTDILTDFHDASSDNIVSLSDKTAQAIIKLKSQFPAGMTTDNIVVNYLTTRFKNAYVTDMSSPSAHFERSINGDDTVHVHLVHNAQYDNYYSESESYASLCKLTLEFQPDSYSPSYSQQDILFGYIDSIPGKPKHRVIDTTGNIVINSANGLLALHMDSIMVYVGEASATNSSGTGCGGIAGEVRIRNNFDLSGFTLDVSTANNIYIDYVTPISGVSATKLSAQTYRLASDSSFAAIAANGSNYTKIADIYYKPACGLEPGHQYQTYPSFSNGVLVYSTSDTAFFASTTAGLVTVTVPQEGCSCGGGSKMAAQDSPALPLDYSLYPCRPNPFNMQTTIAFDLPKPSLVILEIRNILGEKVTTIVNGFLEAGRHEVIWDGKNQLGKDAATGVYFYSIRAANFSSTKKMLLLK
ncbi:exported hypothetical protein [Candidatus Zixiibacteriota bacterium]|nr:exported hypothetical protein [candidate division Zixibacteria bacterium]